MKKLNKKARLARAVNGAVKRHYPSLNRALRLGVVQYAVRGLAYGNTSASAFGLAMNVARMQTWRKGG